MSHGSNPYSVRQLPSFTEPDGRSRALVLPGAHYSADNPVLFLASNVLTECGYEVWALDWDYSVNSPDEEVPFVRAGAEALLEASDADAAAAGKNFERTLILTKSISSLALPWAEEHGFSGIWLTPVLDHAVMKEAFRAARLPHMAVGGTADFYWDSEFTFPKGIDSLEILGATHALQIPGDWRGTISAFETTMEAVERFATTAD